MLRFAAAAEILETDFWVQYNELGGIPNTSEVPGGSCNPADLDPNFTFPQAIPGLNKGRHTTIPWTDADTMNPDFLQVIANTAAFHFPTIEQGGTTLYPALAQRILKSCES